MTVVRRFKVAAVSPVPPTMRIHGATTSVPFIKLPEAMAKFQATVKQPKKDADNPFFGSKYVPLENVVESINAVAPQLGMSFFQWAVQDEKNRIGIATRVNLGEEFIIFDPIFHVPGKGTVQDGGSLQTYLRRYALTAAFGIASEDDDDGNGASKQQQQDQQTETPAQKTYRENQEKKKGSTYQKGDYQNKNNNNAPKTSQNGTNSAPNGSGNTTAATAPEMATEGQITKIKSIVEVIANTQNIHPDDVYPKFQKLYKQDGKPAIPNMDKLTKKWAGHVIAVLNKHNELGQLTSIPPKDEPKKEEPKPTPEDKEREETANYDTEAHGDR